MDEQKRFPIGPGPEDKKPGLGSLLGKLLTRAGRAGRSSREGVEDRPFKFDALQFMIDQYNEEGIQPEIFGEAPDGQSFVIKTPNGGSMIISLEDFIKNFGELPMKAKGIERDVFDQPYRYKAGGRVKYAEGTDNMKMAGYLDPMSEKNDMAMEMFGKQLKDLTEYELELLDEEIDRLRSKFLADGGRVSKQTGGITETRQLPPEFLEAAQKTFLADLTRQAGLPTVTTATTQQPGETAEQFAARQAQAQQFGITRAGMAEVAPQVAAETALQQEARGLASGLGSFQPFLTKATTAADAATALTGTGAGTGAGSIASYQSPYQQQVIDATLTEFDRQAQIRQNQQAAATLGIPGAFGGGREGVQLAEYQASSDRNRAAIQSNLLQQGFQQAQAARQQDLANQQAIANQQRGLGAAAQDFSRAQISGLGTLGAAQQAQNQAILDAQRQAAQMAVDDPRRRLGLLGTGITSITPGAGGVTLQDAPMAAQASPLSQALGFGLMGADIYGRIFRPTGS
jgi:hypothetical protein